MPPKKKKVPDASTPLPKGEKGKPSKPSVNHSEVFAPILKEI